MGLIPWRYGRRQCLVPNETQAGTNGTINSLAIFDPFLQRYNLSALEMAILTAGTHGLSGAGACANNTGFGTLNFVADASLSLGQAWILKTFQSNWTACLSDHGLFQFCAFDPQSNTTLMRLPSDMVFFPSVIQSVGRGLVDLSAKPVETALWTLANAQPSVFCNLFAATYAKMLEIGTWADTLLPLANENPPPPPTDFIFKVCLTAVAAVLLLHLCIYAAIKCLFPWPVHGLAPAKGFKP